MIEDGGIDYSRYGTSDLEDVLEHIDHEKYPLNHRNVVSELERRRRQPLYREEAERTAQRRIPASSPYATIPRRILATFVDAFILTPASAVWSLWLLHPSTEMAVACAVAQQIIWYAYSILGHARYGQTVGKWITGVRVVNVSGGPVTLEQAFVRDSIGVLFAVMGVVWYALPLLGPNDGARNLRLETLLTIAYCLWFIIDIGTALFHPRRRSLHDLVAGTVVEKTPFPWTPRVEPVA